MGRKTRRPGEYPDFNGNPLADETMPIKEALEFLHALSPLTHFKSAQSTVQDICKAHLVVGARKIAGTWFLTPRNLVEGFRIHDNESKKNRSAGRMKQIDAFKLANADSIIATNVIAGADSLREEILSAFTDFRREVLVAIEQVGDKQHRALGRLASDLVCKGLIKETPKDEQGEDFYTSED